MKGSLGYSQFSNGLQISRANHLPSCGCIAEEVCESWATDVVIQPRKHIYFNFTLWQSACGSNPGNCIYVAFVPCTLPFVQKTRASNLLSLGRMVLYQFFCWQFEDYVFETDVVDNEWLDFAQTMKLHGRYCFRHTVGNLLGFCWVGIQKALHVS